MSERISKYIDCFDCIDLSATSGSISIVSFATVIGTPEGLIKKQEAKGLLSNLSIEKF